MAMLRFIKIRILFVYVLSRSLLVMDFNIQVMLLQTVFCIPHLLVTVVGVVCEQTSGHKFHTPSPCVCLRVIAT